MITFQTQNDNVRMSVMTNLQARNPYTGEWDYTFEAASPADVKATCDRVRANQPAWEAAGLEARIAVLDAFASVCEKNFDAIYDALKTDTGRAMIAQYEAGMIRGVLERLTDDCRQMLADPPARPTMGPGIEGSGQWVAYGVLGNISPWNFPLILSLVDTFPALLSGNAAVIKPSEVTPRWVAPFLDCIKQVPELYNVFDIVCGAGDVGAELINHVDVIAFTGSVKTGRIVAEACAKNFIPCFTELGGKDPAIVLESANIDAATSGVLRASVAATGQACQSLERVYVAAPVYDAFVEKIVAKAGEVTLNTHQLEQGHIGPLIFEKQAETIQSHLDDALAKGAKVLHGGEIINQGGLWIEPTILVDVTQNMKVITDETFGPVIPITKFDKVEDAIAMANDTVYGLSGSVYGDTEDAMPIARQMNGGAISINDGSLTAFVHDVESEVFGLSGMGGTRFGPEGVRRFVRRKAILNNTFGPLDVNGEPVPLSS